MCYYDGVPNYRFWTHEVTQQVYHQQRQVAIRLTLARLASNQEDMSSTTCVWFLKIELGEFNSVLLGDDMSVFMYICIHKIYIYICMYT